MIRKIIQDQLDKVEYADLSNFDSATNTYVIKKRVDLKIEEDNCYLIQLKPSARMNQAVITNWNNGSMPDCDLLKIDVAKKVSKMIKVISVSSDEINHNVGKFWSGWLNVDDISILEKL